MILIVFEQIINLGEDSLSFDFQIPSIPLNHSVHLETALLADRRSHKGPPLKVRGRVEATIGFVTVFSGEYRGVLEENFRCFFTF